MELVYPTEQELEDYKNKCQSRPSKRSSARCEIPKRLEHDVCVGRTRGGHWKSWSFNVER